jgi:hypothetical protein
MRDEIIRLRAIRGEEMPTSSHPNSKDDINNIPFLVPFPAPKKLYNCNYCPESFLLETERKEHNAGNSGSLREERQC